MSSEVPDPVRTAAVNPSRVNASNRANASATAWVSAGSNSWRVSPVASITICLAMARILSTTPLPIMNSQGSAGFPNLEHGPPPTPHKDPRPVPQRDLGAWPAAFTARLQRDEIVADAAKTLGGPSD